MSDLTTPRPGAGLRNRILQLRGLGARLPPDPVLLAARIFPAMVF